jgi:uncharacterized damage-inducible protein DinB
VNTETVAAPAASTASAPAADPWVQPLLVQISFLSFAVHRNVDGITHEESLRSPQPGGNNLNWVLGHIVLTRQAWLTAVLGQPALLDPAQLQLYKRGSDPLTDGTLAMPFAELVRLHDASQQPLLDGMARLTAARLGEKAPFSPGKNPDETVGSLVAALCFHEAYHIGQTGVLRRLLGHAGGIA